MYLWWAKKDSSLFLKNKIEIPISTAILAIFRSSTVNDDFFS